MKKLLALLLAVMMIFSLAACGNNEPPSGSEGDKPGTSQNVENNGGDDDASGENKGEKCQNDCYNENFLTHLPPPFRRQSLKGKKGPLSYHNR